MHDQTKGLLLSLLNDVIVFVLCFLFWFFFLGFSDQKRNNDLKRLLGLSVESERSESSSENSSTTYDEQNPIFNKVSTASLEVSPSPSSGLKQFKDNISKYTTEITLSTSNSASGTTFQKFSDGTPQENNTHSKTTTNSSSSLGKVSQENLKVTTDQIYASKIQSKLVDESIKEHFIINAERAENKGLKELDTNNENSKYSNTPASPTSISASADTYLEPTFSSSTTNHADSKSTKIPSPHNYNHSVSFINPSNTPLLRDEAFSRTSIPLRYAHKLKEKLFLLFNFRKLSDENSFKNLDVKIYLASMKTAYHFLISLAIPGLLIMLPVYVLTPPLTQNQSEFDLTTAVNVTNDSLSIWFVIAVSFVFSFIGYYFAYYHWKSYKTLTPRIKDVLKPEYYTIFLLNIDPKDSSHTFIKSYFENFLGESVVLSIVLISNTISISPTVDENSPFTRQTAASTMIDSDHDKSIAFVTFSDPFVAQECLDNPAFLGDNYKWEIQRACPPEDIIWESLCYSHFDQTVRKICFNAGIILIFVVFVPPASVIKLLNPLNYQEGSSPSILILISSWISPLYLFFINSLVLPSLIRYVGKITGYWKKSEVDSYIIHANHMFLLLNTLILPLISFQSIMVLFGSLNPLDIKDISKNLWTILQNSSGSFTYQYVVNSTFITTANQLIHIPSRFFTYINGIKHHFSNRNTQNRNNSQTLTSIQADTFEGSNNKDTTTNSHSTYDGSTILFDFGYWHAFNLSILTVSMVYSVTTPLILIWGTCFFILKYHVDKYNLFYGVLCLGGKKTEKYISGITIPYFMFAISLFQFVMAGFFFLNNNFILNLAGSILLTIAAMTWILLISRNFVLKLSDHIMYASESYNYKRKLTNDEIYNLKLAYRPPEQHLQH